MQQLRNEQLGISQLSPTQAAALLWLLRGEFRVLFWTGAVRAGKTIFAVLLLMLLTVARGPGVEYLIGGRTLGAIERNMRAYAFAWASWLGIPIRWPERATSAEVAGVRWHLIGAPDVKAMDALQGGSLGGALLDEVGLLPQGFVMQAMARTVADDAARVILTMNKLATKHWTRVEMIERASIWNAEVLDAELADNPGVSERAREWLDNVLVGHWHARMVRNEWADATGLVYPEWTDRSLGGELPSEAGVDFGMANPTAGVFVGRDHVGWGVVDEYYGRGAATVAEHARALGAHSSVGRFYVDPSAAALRRELIREVAPRRVIRGNPDFEWGVALLASALASGRVTIDAARAPQLVRELTTLVWDEDAANRGVDRAVRGDDHACDALRYWASRALRPPKELRALPPEAAAGRSGVGDRAGLRVVSLVQPSG